MADIPFLHSPAHQLLDHEHSSNLPCIKSRLFLLSDKNREQALHTLNRLGNAYLFRGFSSHCGASNEQVLRHWQAPQHRSMQIGSLSPAFIQQLHRYEQQLEQGMQLQEVPTDATTAEKIRLMACQYPLLGNKLWMPEDVTLHQKAALLCTALLAEHCLPAQNCRYGHALLAAGINNASIAMQLALQHDCNPLRSYLASLMHSIALLYIYFSLKTTVELPGEHQLLDEIQHTDRRLAYWIAKDWGLPEDILHMLKQRFQSGSATTTGARLLQKSEHAGLAITLFHDKLLSRRQVKNLLQTMELEQLLPLLDTAYNETLH